MSYQYYQPRRQPTTKSVGEMSKFAEVVKNISQSSPVLSSLKNNLSTKPTILRRHRPDYYLVLFMALLWLFGLIVMFAISPQIVNVSNNARGSDTNQYYYFIKQLISVLVAVVAFLVLRRTSVDFLKKYLIWFLLIGFGTSLILFVMSKIVPEMVCSLGACRWIRVGGLSIQAAEVLKFCLLIFFAFFWAHLSENNLIDKTRSLIWSFGLISLAAFVTMVWQKDLGTSVALIFFLVLMLWITSVKKIHVFGVVIAMAALGGLAILAQPYRMARINTFIQGDDASMSNSNRHSIEARIALGSGGLFGLGVGNSIQSTGYLPEAINDSIFPIIGEIFGFVGVLIILALFMALLWRLLHGILYSHNLFSRLIFTGVFGWIFAHLVLNIASMTGLMPMTGITLPFLSYGGTSMVFMAAALGLAFQLSALTAHTPYYQLLPKNRTAKTNG